jgi:hypothetical protein
MGKSASSSDLDCDMFHRHRDRRPEFADGHRHANHARVAAAHLGDPIGQPLEQLMMLAGDNPRDRLGEFAVVDGVGEIVGSARGLEVETKDRVDFERLGANLFLREGTMDSQGADAAQHDAIGRGQFHSRHPNDVASDSDLAAPTSHYAPLRLTSPTRSLRMRRSWAGLGLILMLSASLVGCSKSSNSTGASSDAAKVVALTAGKTFAAGSAKADVTLDYTSLPGVKGAVTLKGVGEFDLKNQVGHMHLDLTPLFNALPPEQRTSLPPNAGDVDIIYSNKVVYMKAVVFASVAPKLKPWLKVDLANASSAASLEQLQTLGGGNDPAQQLKLLTQASKVAVVGKEDVRGEATTHYAATINLDQAITKADAQEKPQFQALKKQTGQSTLPVDIWIDSAGRTRRLRMKISTKDTASTTTSGATPTTAPTGLTAFTTTIDYYDLGTPEKVDIPPADQVSDLGALTQPSTATTSLPTTPTTKKK